MRPRVSIVIPTYNRRERLSRVLLALEHQTVPAETFEAVVVDDGSSDDTRDWLKAQHPPFALRLVEQANSGPAIARNSGIRSATGDLLLFLDDDVEPLPDLVSEHLRSHSLEPDLVVMGPLASLPHYSQPWIAWEQRKVEEQYVAMTRGDWEPTFRQFWTGNASVGREHVVAVGAFNPEFKRAEDVELAHRLHARGLKFRFNSKARGLHHAERSLASWEHAHVSYGKLEVEIFSMWDGDALLNILAGNWARLHPATRLLVKQTFHHQRRQKALSVVLRAWLEAARSLEQPLLSDEVCSVFANLLYWNASVEALGQHRERELFERARALAAR